MLVLLLLQPKGAPQIAQHVGQTIAHQAPSRADRRNPDVEVRQHVALVMLGKLCTARPRLLFDDDFGVVTVGFGGLPDQLLDLVRR